MERQEKIILTNMCMVYDDQGNVLIEDKIVGENHGLIFPGGHVEPRESITDSTIREVFKETGLRVSNLEFCGIKDWVEEDGSRYMVFLYRTNVFSGELKSSSEGNVYWINMSTLKENTLLWHLDLMLDVFKRTSTELFFDRNQR